MSVELPPLPWERSALAPHISEETIDYHYGKHHAAYVTKLNGMIKDDPTYAGKSVEEIMLAAPAGGLFNNAAQTWNHTFYWNSMAPNAGGPPTGPIADAINSSFGSFDEFKKQFSAAAAGHFGSGWAWLVKKDGKLAVVSTHDAGNPLKEGLGTPIMTCDVWEHAYYVDYRNARPAYIEAWWSLVNWEWANARLAEA
ncbi:superoxide dismutase [Nannochloropsis oceanica]